MFSKIVCFQNKLSQTIFYRKFVKLIFWVNIYIKLKEIRKKKFMLVRMITSGSKFDFCWTVKSKFIMASNTSTTTVVKSASIENGFPTAERPKVDLSSSFFIYEGNFRQEVVYII